METYDYHVEEWLSFWRENQLENEGEDESQWKDPESLALGFYEPNSPHNTIAFSAGVYLGVEAL